VNVWSWPEVAPPIGFVNGSYREFPPKDPLLHGTRV
jgi:hypothetical protein